MNLSDDTSVPQDMIFLVLISHPEKTNKLSGDSIDNGCLANGWKNGHVHVMSDYNKSMELEYMIVVVWHDCVIMAMMRPPQEKQAQLINELPTIICQRISDLMKSLFWSWSDDFEPIKDMSLFMPVAMGGGHLVRLSLLNMKEKH